MSVTGNATLLRLRCPAKINLHLRVGQRRPADGFHPLLSWMATVGLFDTLEFTAATPVAAAAASTAVGNQAPGPTSGVSGAAGRTQAPTDRRGNPPRPPSASAARPVESTASVPVPFTLECDPPGLLPCDERNLVVRIANAWRSEIAAATRGLIPLRARLTKRIPAGAGLGGGSSDGARALQAVNRLWRTDRPADELSAFAARFGSDLPFFLFGPSSVCTGRGEVVRPVTPPRPRWAVLALPPVHMPTPDVYRRFDELGLGREQDVADQPDWTAWARLDAVQLLPRLVNDLEPAAFSLRPDLGALRERIESSAGRPVRMSGSGSSLFTLYDAEDEARGAAKALSGLGLPAHGRFEAVEIAPQVEDEREELAGDLTGE
jgi:4-diphosphocytidyl-2-C-methyl-D-erythritol kinase